MSESLGFFWVDGFANQKDQMAEGRSVTPQYFQAMNIPLLTGRFFTEDDVSIPARPTIVNEQFAKKYFADRNPIGGRIRASTKRTIRWSTVVGVVADVRHLTLEEAPQPQMYSPDYEFGGAYVAVRSMRPASAVASEIRGTLKGIDPNLARSDVHTMADLMSEATARRRFQTSLLSVFAAIALFLALVGLYGLMAYSVNCRTHELGIRMALGAQRTDVTLLVLRKAGFLLGSGLAGGLVCTWIATRIIKAFLFGVDAHDPSYDFVGLRVACGLRLYCCADPGAARRVDRSDAGVCGQNKTMSSIEHSQSDNSFRTSLRDFYGGILNARQTTTGMSSKSYKRLCFFLRNST